MAKYVPKKTAVTGTKGPQGIATIQLHPDHPGLARIVYADTDDKYTIKIADQEDNIKPVVLPGTWMVTLTSDHKKIYNIHPVKGVFKLRFVKFAAAKDAAPAPKLNTKYPDNPYLTFTPIFAITEGKEKGMEATTTLHYDWLEEVIEDGKSVIGYELHTSPKAQRSMNMLMGFCDEFGLWDFGPVPYSDNNLPVMEKRLLKAAKVVKTVFQAGWIDSFLEAETKPDTE